jgi:class 3 adenylate cyclase/TolB-like protein/Flp pilus assembly protein TadD
MDRRLTTIVAADIAGFSRLVGLDEEGTLSAQRTHRSELVDALIDRHGGRVANTAGDSLLIEFLSAVEAVRCAVEVQAGMAERNSDIPEDRRILYRIGINVGDVVNQDGDLLGDDVNIAARLEALAPPGGIVLSGTVHDQIRDRLDVQLVDLGEIEVKNIVRPVRAFQVLREGEVQTRAVLPRQRRALPLALAAAAVVMVVVSLAIWWIARPAPNGFDEARALERPQGPTIAVLPFQNLSGDAAQDYLSEGISEDVITELGQFRDLNVLSRRTTEAWRDRGIDIREIGSALDADYVLEGSVRHGGERLRVTARLSDTRSGAQVWSGAFDEVLAAASVFDVQVQITERVASALGESGGAIKRIDALRARTKPPEKLSSYECSMFLPGFLDDRESQKRVAGCIERVVEEEPDYWRGWAQLANALRIDVMLFSKNYQGNQAEKLDRALAAARRAVALNPDAPRAHLALADVLLLRGDREGYFAAAENALALGGDRQVEAEIGRMFIWTGRLDFGAALLRRAIWLNPKSTVNRWHRALGAYHFLKGEYDEAIVEFNKGIDPDYWWAVATEVALYTKAGRKAEAEAALKRLYKLRPNVKIADIVWLYRRFQRPEAHIAKFVEAFQEAGIPEGKYRPLDLGADG